MRQTLILVVTRQARGEVLVRKIALTLWRVTYIMPTSIEQRQEIMFPDWCTLRIIWLEQSGLQPTVQRDRCWYCGKPNVNLIE
ncbi:MAG: hypothetical protein H6Q48_4516 [Deltaproteobacteria bacterium]|nr:hypothetical protein [Deltaproteobacteria bacterium]